MRLLALPKPYLLCCAVLLSPAGLKLDPAQAPDIPARPPDFAQPDIASAADGLVAAWSQWIGNQKDLEQQVFRQPTAEARESIKKGLTDFQSYMEKRRLYSQAVASYLHRNRLTPQTGPTLTPEAVYQRHIQELGMHLAALREKLNAMRDSSEWLSVRRGIQRENDLAFKLQSSRRSDLPIDLTMANTRPAAISLLAFQKLEQELIDCLGQLWSRYYQVLDETIGRNPGGAAPLFSNGGEAPPSPDRQNPLIGVWVYREGSQRFNGVAEPKNVLLELWSDHGALVGRYRAELPTFSSSQQAVDLRLRARKTIAGSSLTLDFESKEPPVTGELVLEGPEGGGVELLVERRVPAASPIPRGREMLDRK